MKSKGEIEATMEAASIQKLSHVVVFPFPFHGHIIPALAFSKSLALRGFFVSFVLPQHRLSRMQEALDRGAHPNIRLAGLPDDVPDDQPGIDEGLNSISWAANVTEAMVDVFNRFIETLMQGSSLGDGDPGAPVGIISDTLLSWTRHAARRWRIPRYVLYPSTASMMSALFYLPPLLAKGLEPARVSTAAPPGRVSEAAERGFDGEDEGEVEVVAIPGLPLLKVTDIHSALMDRMASFGREFYIRHCLPLHEAAGVLINSFYELEPSAISALESIDENPNRVPILPIGPLLPAPFLDENALHDLKRDGDAKGGKHDCLKWLDTQTESSVLFISFGTLIAPSVAQIHEFAHGLEASGQPFLWVLRRPPSIPMSPPPSLSALLPEGFLQRTAELGFIIFSSWAPQLQILAHSAIGGFFTHCGWNSSLESISLGLPMLTMPEFADQRMNCRLLVEQWKIGLEVRRGTDGLADRVEVEGKVRRLMQDLEGKTLRARARDFGRLAKAAVAKNGSSYKNLDRLMQGLQRA